MSSDSPTGNPVDPHEQDKLWRLVDDQLEPAARADLEQQLFQRPDLRQALEDRRRFDRDVRAAFRRAARSQEELADECLAAFERDQAQARVETPRGKLIPWPRLFSTLVSVAAIILLFVGVSSRMAGPLRWAAEEGAGMRGDPAAAGPAAGWRKLVMDELQAAYRRTLPPGEGHWLRGPQSPWRWSVSATPTADGAILIQASIRAAPAAPVAREWEQVFADEAALRRDLPAWAEQVIRDSRAAAPGR